MKRTLFTFIIFSIFILPVAQAGPHADKHSGNAEYSLATEYYKKGDKDEAFKWYVKAANKGHVEAQMSLGFIAHNAKYRPGDHLGGELEWYEKAANQGNRVAQYNLGFAYYKLAKNHTGLPFRKRSLSTYGKAYAWLSIYELNPDLKKHTVKLDDMISFISRKKVKKLKAFLKKQMTSWQLLKTQDVAVKCFESNYKDCSLLSLR